MIPWVPLLPAGPGIGLITTTETAVKDNKKETGTNREVSLFIF
jgi:hypothetical protein